MNTSVESNLSLSQTKPSFDIKVHWLWGDSFHWNAPQLSSFWHNDIHSINDLKCRRYSVPHDFLMPMLSRFLKIMFVLKRTWDYLQRRCWLLSLCKRQNHYIVSNWILENLNLTKIVSLKSIRKEYCLSTTSSACFYYFLIVILIFITNLHL